MQVPDDNQPIPFNHPFIVGKELYYISQAVLAGNLMGDGKFTHQCQSWMQQKFDAKCILLTNSCTAALEMAALLSEVGPGDEVILPSFTFVSTANAFALRGASLRFVDIREDTLNLDQDLLEEAITPATKAIVPVHYAGVGCSMARILDIAAQHGIMVIEDAAQAVNATYEGRYLGTLGALGAYSFHETKNFIAGEGGALVINDPSLIERAEILREKGTNRSRFFRGQVDKYTWVDLGSSFLASEITAAFLYAQLEAADHISTTRTAIWNTYYAGLAQLQERGLARLPHVPSNCQHNGHMFYLITRRPEERTELIDYLASHNINAVFHYIPLHSSPMGLRYGVTNQKRLPVTELVSDCIIRLPCFFEITPAMQARVIDSVLSFYGCTTGPK